MSTESGPNDTDDLSEIITQLEDLAKLALDAEQHQEDIDLGSFVDVHKKLMAVQKMIKEFQGSFAKSIEGLGLSPEDMKPTDAELKTLGSRERKLIEKLGSLQDVCEHARERVHESMQQNPEAVKDVKKELKDSKETTTRRKSRLKGAGGKKGWLPT